MSRAARPLGNAVATAAIREARELAGRGGAHDVVAYVVTAFGADAEARAIADVGDKTDPAERALWGDPAQVAADAPLAPPAW